MNYLRTMLLFCAVLLLSCSALKEQQQGQVLNEGPPLKSVHLLNLPSNVSESQLVSSFSEINKVISDLGYPGAGYRLWKVQGDSPVEHMYLWEGSWPNQAAYDTIHESEAYDNATERHGDILQALRDFQVYQRYSEVTAAVTNR